MESAQAVVEGDFSAWIVCFAASFLHIFVIGFIRSSGILVSLASEKFSRTKQDSGWIVSLIFFVFLTTTPLTLSLAKRVPVWILVAAGGLCLCASLSLSCLSNSLEFLYFTLGVVGGFGLSLSHPTALLLVNSRFKRRRALANGVTMAGASVGAVCLPPLLVVLVDAFAFRGSLLVLGACMLHILVAAALMRDSKPPGRFEEEDQSGRIKRRKSVSDRLKLLLNLRMWVYGLSIAIGIEGFMLNFFVLPQRARSLGLSDRSAALLLQFQGVVDFVARLLTGFLADQKCLSRHQRLMWLLVFMQAALWLTATCTTNYWGLLAFSLIEGVFGGAIITLNAPCLVGVFGIDRLPLAFGLSGFIESFVMLGLPPVLGHLFDKSGSWNMSMVVVGVVLAVAGCLLLIDDVVSSCRCHSAPTQAKDDLDVEDDDVKDTEEAAEKSLTT